LLLAESVDIVRALILVCNESEPIKMPIASMTGFARVEGHAAGLDWVWEARSVNARGLDIRLRLPPGRDTLEAAARALVQDRFRRGSLNLNLSLNVTAGTMPFAIDMPVLEQILALRNGLGPRIDQAPPLLENLLLVPGVVRLKTVEETDVERAEREAALLASLAQALDQLKHTRGEEGKRLAQVLAAQLQEMRAFVAAARRTAAVEPEAVRARLKEQIRALLDAEPALSEDRLAAEAALLAVKADAREELDRLDSHLEQVEALVAGREPVGRRLDFLCQELNREANTLCAKANDVELVRIGLSLKAGIEQFREQIQNVE
jgi:uncharacterized protein (TIGR00255 family)